MITVDSIIEEIIVREGGYVDNPDDKGGPTKFGVTLMTLTRWRKRACTRDDVKNLGQPEAHDILKNMHAIDPGFTGIEDPKVLGLAVDCSVNHGPRNAAKLCQKAAHIYPDGMFGPVSCAAVNRITPAAMYRNLIAARLRFFGEIVTHDPTQAKFDAGWMNRVALFVEDMT